MGYRRNDMVLRFEDHRVGIVLRQQQYGWVWTRMSGFKLATRRSIERTTEPICY